MQNRFETYLLVMHSVKCASIRICEKGSNVCSVLCATFTSLLIIFLVSLFITLVLYTELKVYSGTCGCATYYELGAYNRITYQFCREVDLIEYCPPRNFGRDARIAIEFVYLSKVHLH